MLMPRVGDIALQLTASAKFIGLGEPSRNLCH